LFRMLGRVATNRFMASGLTDSPRNRVEPWHTSRWPPPA